MTPSGRRSSTRQSVVESAVLRFSGTRIAATSSAVCLFSFSTLLSFSTSFSISTDALPPEQDDVLHIGFVPSDCWKDPFVPFNFATCCLDPEQAHLNGCWDHLHTDADKDYAHFKCCLNRAREDDKQSDEFLVFPEKLVSNAGSSVDGSKSLLSGNGTLPENQRYTNVVTFPVVLSRQEVLSLLRLKPSQVNCGCTYENYQERFLCHVHRSLAMTEDLPRSWVHVLATDFTIGEISDCPIGAMTLILTVAARRASFILDPSDNPGFLYVEQALLILFHNPHMGVFKEMVESGFDMFNFIENMRGTYLPRGVLAAYRDWECMDIDPPRENFMYHTHLFSRGGTMETAGLMPARPDDEGDPFYLKNALRILLRDERKHALRWWQKNADSVTSKKRLQEGLGIRNDALDATDNDIVNVRERNSNFGINRRLHIDDLHAVTSVHIPERLRDIAVTFYSPVDIPLSAISSQSYKEEKGYVSYDHKKHTDLMGADVITQHKIDDGFLEADSDDKWSEPLRWESLDKCYFVDAYAYFSIYQGLQSRDMHGHRGGIGEFWYYAESLLREQLLFSKRAYGKSELIDLTTEQWITKEQGGFPNIAVELRTDVTVSFHKTRNADPAEDETSIPGVASGEVGTNIATAANGMWVTEMPLSHSESGLSDTRKSDVSKRQSGKYYEFHPEKGVYVPQRGWMRGDPLRKLMYTTVGINGLLSQLTQARKVWVSDGGRWKKRERKGLTAKSSKDGEQTDFEEKRILEPEGKKIPGSTKYFQMQLFNHRELASTYVRYRRSPFCNMDPFREILRTLDNHATEPYRIVEGGAHLGDCALLAASLLQKARITAIEPLADAAHMIQLSSTANQWTDRLTVVPVALGSRAAAGSTLELTHLPGRSASASAFGGGYIWNCEDKSLCRVFNVTVGALEDYSDFAHMVKLSIQGAEVDALFGAQEMLKDRNMCSLMMYFGKVNLGTTTKINLETFLKTSKADLGFWKEHLFDEKQTQEETAIAPDALALGIPADHPYHNCLAKARDRSRRTVPDAVPAASYDRCVSVVVAKKLWNLVANIGQMDIYYLNYGEELVSSTVSSKKIRAAQELHSVMQANLDLLEEDEDAFWKEYFVGILQPGKNKRCNSFSEHVRNQLDLEA